MTTSIWWIRRDLRLTDNQALTTALASSDQIVPLFIIDPKLINSSYNSPRRSAFMMQGLEELDESLKQRGSGIVFRQGNPIAVLTQLVEEVQATAIYAERDYSPYATRRDAKISETLPLHLADGLTVRPINLVQKKDGNPYTVYTPYSKAWKRLSPITRADILASPRHVPSPANLQSTGIEEMTQHIQSYGNLLKSGEEVAKGLLGNFVGSASDAIYGYAQSRDFPEFEGTSRLSPYLRFGMVSARLAALAAYEAMEREAVEKPRAPKDGEEPAEKPGPEVWLNELIWRDFYTMILANFPHVRARSFRPQYDKIQWANDEGDFQAWCYGRTGYPFVDAAMRQLFQSGWMHNRARMVVASFLVKDLLIDWRWGERWFMQQLLDGDPAANNGGWQWAAGTGTDAAPYFRIFNPVSQGKKFDKEGVYVRRWVPELTTVPNKFIHEPWLMPKSEQIKARISIGDSPTDDYPLPIVDHKWARERTLAAYKSATAE